MEVIHNIKSKMNDLGVMKNKMLLSIDDKIDTMKRLNKLQNNLQI